jgi:uncharacterized protein YlaI
MNDATGKSGRTVEEKVLKNKVISKSLRKTSRSRVARSTRQKHAYMRETL